MKLQFIVNGYQLNLEVAADRRAVDLLRQDLGLTGTKEGCGSGECGACTILVEGEAQLSCLMLASQLAGKRITTIEGMASGPEKLHPLQQSFVDHGAVQCGFCTPGMVITAGEFLARRPHADRTEMAEAISGNLCRCTGYRKILDAMEEGRSSIQELPAVVPGHSRPLVSLAVSNGSVAGRPVFSPENLAQLWAIRAENPEAQLIAGGTDLLVWLRNRRIDPPAMIELGKITDLRGISENSDGIRIGALTSHAQLLDNHCVNELFPVLKSALHSLGSPHIRRMGTIGGNIVTASPAGDSLPPLHVLGAEVELRSLAGSRRLALADFILGPGKTALATGEILAAILVPHPPKGAIQHFEKIGLRSAMACSVASFAAVIGLRADGTIQSARLAWGSVGPTVMTIPAVEAALIGERLNRDTLQKLIPLARKGVTPIDDVRASGVYRRMVAGNLLLRLLEYGECRMPENAQDLSREKKT